MRGDLIFKKFEIRSRHFLYSRFPYSVQVERIPKFKWLDLQTDVGAGKEKEMIKNLNKYCFGSASDATGGKTDEVTTPASIIHGELSRSPPKRQCKTRNIFSQIKSKFEKHIPTI